MKRIAKLLAKIYPAAWRERYGDEFQGLIEDKALRMRDLFDVLRGGLKMQLTSRWFFRVALPCALVGVVVALLIFFSTPRLYSSGTTMVLSSPYSSSAGGTGEQMKPADAAFFNRELAPIVAGALGDRDAMTAIIQRYNLYPAERAKMPLDDVIRKMQEAIRVFPLSTSRADAEIHRAEQTPGRAMTKFDDAKRYIRGGFVVQFAYPDARVAQHVDAEVVRLIVRKNLMRAMSQPQAEAQLQADLLEVIDAPNLPTKPIGQPLIVKCGIGLLGGLLCGFALILVGAGAPKCIFESR